MTSRVIDARLRIPAELLPADGRFGSGPSRIRPQQIDDLTARGRTLLGTSHRQEPVLALVGSVQAMLAELFSLPDGYEVLLGNGGSTAFWDAAAFGLVDQRAQTGVFGEFGGKFARAAAAPWLQAPDVVEAPTGTIAQLHPVEGVDLYALPHNETSTGAMAPVRRIAPGTDALTMIDATSAAGGILVDPDEFDVYYFAPQKNFGADGGLWFALVSPAAIERIERIAASGRYIPAFLSLATAVTSSRKRQTLNTPALATLSLIESQLRWMLEQGGLAWADARTRTSSALVYDWAERRPDATPFVAAPQERSQVVATIDFAESIDAATLAAALRANGIVDTEPYRKLGRNQLRIATFTSVEPDDVARLLRCIDYLLEARES